MAAWSPPESADEYLDKYLKGKIPDSELAFLRGKLTLKSETDKLRKEVSQLKSPSGLISSDDLLDEVGLDEISKESWQLICDVFAENPGPDLVVDLAKRLVPRCKFNKVNAKLESTKENLHRAVTQIGVNEGHIREDAMEMETLNNEIEDLERELVDKKTKITQLKKDNTNNEKQIHRFREILHLPTNATLKDIENRFVSGKRHATEYEEYKTLKNRFTVKCNELHRTQVSLKELQDDLEDKKSRISCLESFITNQEAQKESLAARSRGKVRREGKPAGHLYVGSTVTRRSDNQSQPNTSRIPVCQHIVSPQFNPGGR